MRKRSLLIQVIVCASMLLLTENLSAQIGAGLRFGGNLSHVDGHSFRSAKKIGLQAGIALRYRFTKHFALQAEPTYNIGRVRANEQTKDIGEGIEKGTKSLHYLTVPLFFKLNITPKFALLGGPELSRLANDSKYKLNNGKEAFKDGTRLGYSIGLELGSIYFRYREVKRIAAVHRDLHAAMVQYQLGVNWDLF